MTALTNYAEDLLINFLFNDETATRPTAWYIQLHTGDPGETGASNQVSGNGFARQQATFAPSSSGITSNEADEVFGPCTGSDWGTVSHISVWDALTSGNCLAKGALTASKLVEVGDSVTLATGDLVISLD